MPVTLDIPGIEKRLRLFLHDAEDICVSREIRANGIWEPYETSLLLRYLQPGGVFMDIGANIGYYTVLGATIIGPGGLVAAYEPDPDNFSLLQRNLEINRIDNALAFPCAVADYHGSADIYRCGDNRGDHRLYDSGDNRCRQAVRVVNGGEHIRSVTDRVDFIKIDTQGSEFHIVNSLQQVIRRERDHLVMVVEFWPHGLRLAGASGQKLLKLLDSFGLYIHIIDHIGYRLYPVSADCLLDWTVRTEADTGNEGFMNLLLLPEAMIPAGKERQCAV